MQGADVGSGSRVYNPVTDMRLLRPFTDAARFADGMVATESGSSTNSLRATWMLARLEGDLFEAISKLLERPVTLRASQPAREHAGERSHAWRLTRCRR